MRPLELELSGFRSYEHATLDLRPHELVVIGGDTGSGKSSLLDAVAFALYGRTPELGSTTGELVTLGRDQGEVRLTFAMDGAVWRVARRFGRGAPQPRHLLERLEYDGGPPVDRVDGETNVNRRLVKLVGLTYEAFTSTVLLAQGQFARFFAARAAERDDILRELFAMPSLEPVRSLALQRAAADDAEVRVLTSEAARHDVDAGALRSRARRARADAANLAALRRALPRVERWRAATADAEAARGEVELLTRISEALPDVPARRALAEEVDAEDARRGEAAALMADAERALSEATADRESAEARYGGSVVVLLERRATMARLTTLTREAPLAAERLTRAVAALAVREDDLTAERDVVARERARIVRERMRADDIDASAGAREALAVSAHALLEAQEELAARATAADLADAALAAATAASRLSTHAHAVARLRATLAPGDECPVCGAQVDLLPERGAQAGDEDVDAVASDRHASAASARTEQSRATVTVARLQDRHDALAEASARAASALAESDRDAGPTDVASIRDEADLASLALEPREAGVERERAELGVELGRLQELERQVVRDERELAVLRDQLGSDGRADAGLLEASIHELRALGGAEDAMRDRERLARAALDGAERSRAELERTRLAAVRQAVAIGAERLGEPPPDPSLGGRDLLAVSASMNDRVVERARLAAQRHAAQRTLVETLEGKLRSVGVAEPGAVEGAVTSTRLALAESRSLLGAAYGAIGERRRLGAARGDARSRAERCRQIAFDLRAERFPRFLLQQARREIALAASARLQDLSAGGYRFAASDPDPLAIVDVRRGERTRGVATLSGGERFLASLALALALGDVAAGSGGRLDCLFIDEGFSTLDAESLELAIAGIERLSGRGRLIGVITHLPGVAERLGAAIRVAKDASGVSGIVDEGALT